MNGTSQFAVPVALGFALALGIAGCAKDRHDDIPSDAREMVSGRGDDDISFRTPSDGRIYIEDTTRSKIVYSGDVKRDQMVTVQAGKDRVTADGNTLTDMNLDDGHRYRIHFDPGERVTKKTTTVEERRSTER